MLRGELMRVLVVSPAAQLESLQLARQLAMRPIPSASTCAAGSELLHCEERGVWIRKGELRPDPAQS